MEQSLMRWLIFLFIGFFVLQILHMFYKLHRGLRRRDRIRSLFAEQIPISPKEFMGLRKRNDGKLNPALHVPGVYVLHNESKDLYYVGQGKSVGKRVFSHFNGSGNGDVYADYKYDDDFTIRLLALADSGYDTLDELERYTIAAYSAHSKGYNRTRGNGWKTA